MANQKNVDPRRQAIAMSYHNKGTVQTLRNIVKHRGVKGMYTGLNLHLSTLATRSRPCPRRLPKHHLYPSPPAGLTHAAVRDTLGTGIYFATYESSKQLLTTFSGTDAHKNPMAVLVAGGLCGIVSWALICGSTCFLSYIPMWAQWRSMGGHVALTDPVPSRRQGREGVKLADRCSQIRSTLSRAFTSATR